MLTPRFFSLATLLSSALCIPGALTAQLSAGFTASITGGCSPITVSFANSTTGASKTATYTWDFGNGNQVTTPDSTYSSGATYVNPGTYTVSLTVQDGASTSTKSFTVVVYSNPTASFGIIAGSGGCAPLAANFLSTSAAGSGTISRYYWDFGDGTTESVTNPSVSHTYTFPGSPTVELTVTNSYGCTATEALAGLVSVAAPVQTAFSTDSTSVCVLGNAVPFINATTGPGTLSYLWKFGDGTTSTAMAPSHDYAAPGTYSVSLLVTSTAGCSDSLQKTAYINVANYKPALKLPLPICTNVEEIFADSSNPAPIPGSEVWNISTSGYQQYGQYAYYTFYKPGTYTISMAAVYGSCPASASQTVTVYPTPALGGFLDKSDSACGVPTTWQFSDTSTTAVAWDWYASSEFGNLGSPFATTRSASYTFTQYGGLYMTLAIVDAHGCTATTNQIVNIQPPGFYLNVVTTNPTGTVSCTPITVTCNAVGNLHIVQYLWNFGDGTTSTDSMPTHTYSTPGNYSITLQWVTSNGCKGTSTSNGFAVQIDQPTVMNFSISPANPVCGNLPITVQATGTNFGSLYWDFGDGSGTGSEYYTSTTHQYSKEGTYTITLIATGYNNYCRDTVTKVDSVIVLPSFPNILSASNTCSGSRGQVSFTDSIRGATGITWNFGDGSTLNLSSPEDTFTHVYTKSGVYQVMLTTTNANCTNKDSTTVYVLVKQHPLLSSPQSIVCADSALQLTINQLDTNYQATSPGGQFVIGPNYYSAAFQYGNGSAYASEPWSGGIPCYYTTLTGSLVYLQPGEDSIRAILTSALFYCNDTTNWIPVKISGPIVGFEAAGNNCYRDPVLFTDTSRPSFGGPIVQYQWTFGDGTSLTSGTGGAVSHIYPGPGTYYPHLKVTDSSGCTTSTTDIAYIAVVDNYTTVQVNGPQASFYWTPANITPGTTATFINSSTGPYNAALWTFASDGSTSTNLNSVNHTYPNITTDTVTLVVYDNTPGYCPTDTSVQIVPVRSVSASFTYVASYVNGNNCPPVVLSFSGIGFNVTDWAWNFGDGATAQGNPNPSHTYNTPGKYYITLTATGSGVSITSVDSVIVKGPYASIQAVGSQGCAPATVTMTAHALNAVSYIWDFGDGTVVNASDTVLSHTYSIPGVYTPTLTLEDSLGCKASFSPPGKVVADSLHTLLGATPLHLCDSGQVQFSPGVYSISATNLGEGLIYHWDFGTGNPADTSASANPVFAYTTPGNFPVMVSVTSLPGCLSQSLVTVVVTRSDPGSISGPANACPGDTLHFTGSPDYPATVGWNWLLPGGGIDTNAQALFIAPSAGSYVVSLVSTIGGCFDTSKAPLTVNPLPAVDLVASSSWVCLGDSVSLSAHDGVSYQWTPAAGLSNPTVAAPYATPAVSTTYTVQVTNAAGCGAEDSVLVSVSSPFIMKIPADTFLCNGDSILLDPQGAYTYQWLAPAAASGAIWVNPTTSTTYTVAGFDAHDCFSDTASVTVTVEPGPELRVNPVGPLPAGNSVPLTTVYSPDVVTWSWTPAASLSCNDCSNPIATPDSSTFYTVTASTIYGCKASDTLTIRLVCHENSIVVPNSFTPNGDGINDIFYPEGKGVRVIRDFRIYGRWGNLVFERHNIPLGDISNGWDGRIDGMDQPPGAYIYFLDVICDTGDAFTLKGTVMLER